MNLDMHNAEWLALYLHIGHGREAPDGNMTLTMEYSSGCNLSWCNVHPISDGQKIGCESTALSQWLYAAYPVGVFDDYECEFYPVLTSLALEPAEDFFYQMRFTAGELTSSVPVSGWYPVLTLHRDGSHLPLILKDWSAVQLKQLTGNWLSWNTSEPLVLPFPLCVGHRMLTIEKVLALQAGDGIVLQSTADIYKNHLWLAIQEKRIVMSVNETEVQVISVQDDAVQASHTEMLSDISQLPVRVVAEVGVVRLPLNEFANIAPGMVFPTKAAISGEVRLTINGACIGHGSMMAINDTLVVRIESLINGSSSRPVVNEVIKKEIPEVDSGGDHGMAG